MPPDFASLARRPWWAGLSVVDFPRRRPHYLRTLSLNKHNRLILNEIRAQHLSRNDSALSNERKGNTDQFGLAVIADEAKGVVERSSRNG
ncbi:hypothetical protein, partial [Burkholderia multivorans]|uniref:hypothetical protein n=1 Tax=Burkholderia multivorans TaxID=87883 RepID=UPI001C613D60